MTLVHSFFQTCRGYILPATNNLAFKHFFSSSLPLPRNFNAPSHQGKVAYRVRKARTVEHPALRKIKDPAILQAIPRTGKYISKFEYRFFHRLRNNRTYHQYFDLSYGNEVETEGAIHQALLGRNIYDAAEFLTRTCFKDKSLDFRESLYAQLWQDSVQSTPHDLTQVLNLISTWVRIGIRPCNLISEAIRLLPTNMNRETIVLCAFYMAMGSRKPLPADRAIFPILEAFLRDHGSELTMFELVMICEAFYRSSKPFQQSNLDLCHVIKARFLELLPTTPWTADAHHIFLLLKFNNHGNVAQMQALGPALQASDFFDYCRKFPRSALHELVFLCEYLENKEYRDEALLSQCVAVLRELWKKEDAYTGICMNFPRLFYVLASLDVELDEEMIAFGVNFFQQNPPQEPIAGQDLLFFLRALALKGIFPHKLIHMLFSSQDLMRVENGSMRGFTFKKVDHGSPSFFELALLRLDLCVGLLCPDYRGARLPREVNLGGMGR